MKNLKTALIGLGRMGADPSSRFGDSLPLGWLPITHAEAIQSVPGYQLIALCDSDVEKTKKFCKIYGVTHAYQSYETLLKEQRPEVVSIATRTAIRYPIIMEAITSGVKGIYAEKPLANNLQDVKDIVLELSSRNVKLAYGSTRRAMPIYQKAREISWGGELGAVKHIAVEFGYSMLMWTLPHATDLITFFAGDTKLVRMKGSCDFDLECYNSKTDVLDADPKVSDAFFEFENGVTASIVPIDGPTIRIECEKGIVAVIADGERIVIEHTYQGGSEHSKYEEILPDEGPSGTQHIFEDLRDAINKKQDLTIIRSDEIITSHAMLFGIVQSQLNGGNFISVEELASSLKVTGRFGSLSA